jgi:UDPglucose--hexose-1-phosphate uridylyltransferase
VCPFWAGEPFELLVIPRTCSPHLHAAASDDLAAAGVGIRYGLRRIQERVGDVAHNIVFHSAPYHHVQGFHWHAHVWPKLATQAGFERGTGVLINIVAPEVAADRLR